MRRVSKAGLLFAGLYAIGAAILFRESLTCATWMCDLVALPVFLPAGYIFWAPFSGPVDYIPDPLDRWIFVVPAALTNLVLYYYVGYGLGAAIGALRRTLKSRSP